jgi:hypothetical protein
MDGRAARIETAVDAGAAALFAAAAAYALHALATGSLGAAALGGGTSLALVFAGLRQVQPIAPPREQRSPTPVTALLEEADRALSEPRDNDDALVLDDILAKLAPDSRVVRLFDPADAPTPGQLHARIDRHLGTSQKSDASQSLHDALAQLRRSLN